MHPQSPQSTPHEKLAQSLLGHVVRLDADEFFRNPKLSIEEENQQRLEGLVASAAQWTHQNGYDSDDIISGKFIARSALASIPLFRSDIDKTIALNKRCGLETSTVHGTTQSGRQVHTSHQDYFASMHLRVFIKYSLDAINASSQDQEVSESELEAGVIGFTDWATATVVQLRHLDMYLADSDVLCAKAAGGEGSFFHFVPPHAAASPTLDENDDESMGQLTLVFSCTFEAGEKCSMEELARRMERASGGRIGSVEADATIFDPFPLRSVPPRVLHKSLPRSENSFLANTVVELQESEYKILQRKQVAGKNAAIESLKSGNALVLQLQFKLGAGGNTSADKKRIRREIKDAQEEMKKPQAHLDKYNADRRRGSELPAPDIDSLCVCM